MSISRFITGARRGPRGQTREQGFTLLEVVVGALLLLVLMAAMVPVFLSGLSQTSSIRYKSMGTNIARQQMEAIRLLDYRDITDASTLAAKMGISVVQAGITFNISYTVADVTISGGPMKKVTVSVSSAGAPTVAAAEIATLIHQQYSGPRGCLLEVSPLYSDPLNSPFSLIKASTTVKYHINPADWGLILEDLNQASMAVHPGIHARLYLVDEWGASLPIGDAASDYELGPAYLKYTKGSDGKVNDVWFQYTFDASKMPDGYWELDATAYNEYGEPGDTWADSYRIENNAPDNVTVTATAVDDGVTICVNWTRWDRDISEYQVQRRKMKADGNWDGWKMVVDHYDGKALGFDDVGTISPAVDPYGTLTAANTYQYQIRAKDIAARDSVWFLSSSVCLPPNGTTELSPTSTTLASTTTSTVPTYAVKLNNKSSVAYIVTIKDSAGTSVYNATVGVRSAVTVPGLVAGNYSVTATAVGKTTLSASFALPKSNKRTVLTMR